MTEFAGTDPLLDDPTSDDDLAAQFGNISEEDHETRGQTTVATRRGYRFAPQNKDLPVIHSGGVKMSKEDAEAVVKESEGTTSPVHIVKPKSDENDENEED